MNKNTQTSTTTAPFAQRTSGRLTPEEAGEVERYLAQFPPFTPLTQEEECELFRRIRDGDTQARDRAVERNMRFVISIAKEYAGRGVPIEDLIQEGSIGLMRAIERFDCDRGTRFSTFAFDHIHLACSRAVQNTSSLIRIPVYVRHEARRAARRRTQAVSLDTELSRTRPHDGGDGECITLADVIADPNANTEEDATQAITQAVQADQLYTLMARVLTPRERAVVILLYGLGSDHEEGMTHEQIAKHLGIARNTVGNCHMRALAKLRTALAQETQDIQIGQAA